MEILCTAREYVAKLLAIKENYKTWYGWGAFGAPATAKNKARYKEPDAPAGSFMFDCSGFAYKAIPWGWCGNYSKTYGGATYKKHPYEELDSHIIDTCCYDVSSDFSKIQIGELLYMRGHVGVYIGDGRAIECTSKWENGVLISDVDNIFKGANKYHRKWLKHAKMPFLKYDVQIPKDDIYIVKKGDNLTKIAREFNVNLWELARINKINNINLIRIGQQLIIPRR